MTHNSAALALFLQASSFIQDEKHIRNQSTLKSWSSNGELYKTTNDCLIEAKSHKLEKSYGFPR
ncbi:unnamed protein product, partial [Ceratitis capitata]